MIYGYARVRAQDQNLDTQIEQLLKYGIDKIVKEKISGVSQAALYWKLRELKKDEKTT